MPPRKPSSRKKKQPGLGQGGSQPGIQKRSRSIAEKQKQQQIAAAKNLTDQVDGSKLDLTSLPSSGSEARATLTDYGYKSYQDVVIFNPRSSRDYKPEYDRGHQYTTLDEAILRFSLPIFPFVRFYQDSSGYWHAYVEIESP